MQNSGSWESPWNVIKLRKECTEGTIHIILVHLSIHLSTHEYIRVYVFDVHTISTQILTQRRDRAEIQWKALNKCRFAEGYILFVLANVLCVCVCVNKKCVCVFVREWIQTVCSYAEWWIHLCAMIYICIHPDLHLTRLKGWRAIWLRFNGRFYHPSRFITPMFLAVISFWVFLFLSLSLSRHKQMKSQPHFSSCTSNAIIANMNGITVPDPLSP